MFLKSQRCAHPARMPSRSLQVDFQTGAQRLSDALEHAEGRGGVGIFQPGDCRLAQPGAARELSKLDGQLCGTVTSTVFPRPWDRTRFGSGGA
jgi:hypothetical protein